MVGRGLCSVRAADEEIQGGRAWAIAEPDCGSELYATVACQKSVVSEQRTHIYAQVSGAEGVTSDERCLLVDDLVEASVCGVL